MSFLAVPEDVYASLLAMATADLGRWVRRATSDGLCDFHYLSTDPEFMKQAVREKARAAASGSRAYEFVYSTPSGVTYHFLFVAPSEEDLRGRLAVLEIMAL